MPHSDDYFVWFLKYNMVDATPEINSLRRTAIEIRRMEQLEVVDLNAEMEQLERQIDKTLETGDREEFMRLSERYKYLKAETC